MKRIVIIGSGNVATNIAIAFAQNGIKPIQIISKNIKNAQNLAEKINCKNFTNKPNKILDADVYFLCVNDDNIKQISDYQALTNKTIVHTSGSTDISILNNNQRKYGVFYPLQTFNKQKIADFREIPVCIEASDNETQQLLVDLAKKISQNVHLINSQERLKIHIAAVFVNNFVNHLFTIANNIIKDDNINPDILNPLIYRTIENAITSSPYKIQTGPARRNDTTTISKHIEILHKLSPEYSKIYENLTNSIKKLYS